MMPIKMGMLGLVGMLFVAGSALAAEKPACPITGNEVNEEIWLDVNGKRIYFCSEKCPQQYQKALNLTDKGPEKCPISGKSAKKDKRLLHIKSEVKYFCCGNCPKKFAEQNGLKLTEGEAKSCPISGNPAKKEYALVHNGESIYFCCDKCPQKYLNRIQAQDGGPAKCPISGKEAKQDRKMVYTHTEAVYFCSDNCQQEYVEAKFASKSEEESS